MLGKATGIQNGALNAQTASQAMPGGAMSLPQQNCTLPWSPFNTREHELDLGGAVLYKLEAADLVSSEGP